ncbi:hypothetical protein ACFY7Z_04070 [Streptomyces sp. NPDC012623]|uniref:hypothetical protein n=1 Tax=unclassified Streptomyces TaxID=2593676 RepID=UPI0036AA681A
MADERDAWLDKHAAERLLRGEPVAASDDEVVVRSERLGRALRDMTAVTYANDTELPGEEAALAAFRQARTTGGHQQLPSGDELPVTVRITRVTRSVLPARAARPARPVRGRLVVAMTGCALGAMAVAAAAGMLPPLFDGEALHAPANSVSAAASQDPAPTGEPGGGVPPDGPPRRGTGEPSSAVSSAAGVTGSAGRTGPDGVALGAAGHGGTAGGVGAGREAGAGDGPAIGPDGEHRGRPGPGADAETVHWYARTSAACRDYTNGDIDPQRRRALESATQGPEGAERYCAELLKEAGTGPFRGGGDRNGPHEHEGGHEGDGDGGGGRGGGGAETPGIQWSLSPDPSDSPHPKPHPKPTPMPTASLSGPPPGSPAPSDTPAVPSVTTIASATGTAPETTPEPGASPAPGADAELSAVRS